MYDQLHGSFVSFIKTGDPNGSIPVRWEPCVPESRKTMLIDTVSSLAENPRGEDLKVWEGLELYK